MNREYYQEQAVAMAHIHAKYLLQNSSHSFPEASLSQAIDLIQDCARHLHQPTLAIQVALSFHPVVERWSTWSSWAAALDVLLESIKDAAVVLDKVKVLNNRGQAARELGDYSTAEEMSRTALHLSEALCDGELISASLNKLGLIALKRDNLNVAQQYLAQAYNLGEKHLPPIELGHISMNLGLIATQQGNYPEAQHNFHQAIHRYSIQNDIFHLTKAQCNLADLCRRMGQLERVPAELIEACNTFQSMGARQDYGLAQNELGCIYLSMSQFEQAQEAFQVAIAEFDSLGAMGAKALVLSNLAELYVTAQDWNNAVTVLKEARELARICQKPLLVAAIDVDEGRMFAAQGNYKEARSIWRSAMAVQTSKAAHGVAHQTQHLIDTLPM